MTTERRPQNKDAAMTDKELFLEQHKDSPEDLYDYAKDIIKGRWPEAEPTIMTSPAYAYHYAYGVIKGSWPEAEPIIMASPGYAYYYSKYIIKDRWPEAEPAIMKNSYCWKLYKDHFKL